MSAQNINNNLSNYPVQQQVPVQKIAGYIPPQVNQSQIPANLPIQNNSYIPRYMPLIQQGQVYPVAIPQTQPNYYEQPKSGNVGAVNITINGVNPPAQPAAPQYVPIAAPSYVVPPQINNALKTTPEENPNIKKESMKVNTEKKEPEEKLEKKPEEKPKEIKEEKPQEKLENKKNKKQVTELTDGYIKQLEKKLNNNDKNERAHAVAELIKRFKEDETRKDDKRLTSLLNLSLQDESKPIVFAAMQAIENGYANGNKVTEQRLQAIVEGHDNFGNSETAERLLLKMSDNKSSAKSINTDTEQNNPGQKLNLVSK